MNQVKKQVESSGGETNYYLVNVTHPNRETNLPYTAECEDIIDALQMNFYEANIFKEIWRTANARLGRVKKGNTTLRAAEKIHHYAVKILTKELRDGNNK